MKRRARRPSGPKRSSRAAVDRDALLCALVLAPETFSRNRFFDLFEETDARRVRRRAGAVRAILRDLLGRAKHASPPAEVVGEHILEDGRVLLKYRIDALDLERATALAPMEAAAVRFALHRAEGRALPKSDREAVEKALAKLGREIDLKAN